MSTQQLIMRLQRYGLEVSRTRNGHIRIETPQGPVFTSSSPSDWRSVRNMVARLRARGIDIDRRDLL